MPRARLLPVLGLLTSVACTRARTPAPVDIEPEPAAAEPSSAEPEPEPETDAAPVDDAPPDEPAPAPEPDRQALAAAVREQLPTLTPCYEDALQQDRSLRGKLRVTITIEAGGWVSEAIIDEDGVGSEAVRACVVERLRAWSFATTELREPTELGFAVDFEPTG